MIEAVLSRIGLTAGEIRVYLALVELGQTKIGPVISRAGISGSKAYEVLDRLIAKGLVSYIIKAQTKWFMAAPASRLLDYLDEQEQKIKQTKLQANKIIGELDHMQRTATQQHDAIVFKGLRGLKTAYTSSKEDVSKGETIYGMFIPQVNDALLPFFTAYIKDFSKRLKVKNLLLFNEYVPEIEKVKKIPGVDIRIVPEPFKSPTEIAIHNNNVVIATTGSKEYIALLIKNKDIADSFKQYFNTVWKLSAKLQ